MLVYDDVDSLHHIQIYDKSVAVEFQSGFADFSDFRTRIRAGDLVVPNIRLTEPLSAEIEHFADCVEHGQTPRTDGVHGSKVVAVLEAMSRSMASDGAATVVEFERPTHPVIRQKPTTGIIHTPSSPVSRARPSPAAFHP